MNQRIERILYKLLQQYAFYAISTLPTDESRMRTMATTLAQNGILVLLADVPAEHFDAKVTEWVGAYSRLYNLLAKALFPSFARHEALYADSERPPVVVIRGDSAPIVQAFANWIVPYVAVRQKQVVSDAELRGIMTYILDDLEAHDLPRMVQDQLWQEGVQLIRAILALPIRHYTLTVAKAPLAQLMIAEPREKPATAPETIPDHPTPPKTQTQEMFVSKIPVFFSGAKDKEGKRKPPVPPPPKKKS